MTETISATAAIFAPAAAPAAPSPVARTATDAPAPAATPAADAPFYSGITDEAKRGYLENKGWKTIEAMTDSYQNLEKMVGRDKLVKPKDAGDTEAWAAINELLGVPKTPEAYDLKAPEGGNPEFVQTASKWFHEAGIGKEQASKIMTAYTAFEQQQQQAQLEAAAVQAENDMKELQKEWGAAYTEKQAAAKQAVTMFGITEEKLHSLELAMGSRGLMEFMANIGEKLGEDKAIGFDGQRSNRPMTPAAAKDRLSSLALDKQWASRIFAGDKEALAEQTRLSILASS